MARHRMKPYAPIALFVATLFAFGNVAHSVEHDYLASSSPSHAECNHCSIEQTAAVSHAAISAFCTVYAVDRRPVVSSHVAVPTSNFQARAPPLS
jgi:hypothetical protein